MTFEHLDWLVRRYIVTWIKNLLAVPPMMMRRPSFRHLAQKNAILGRPVSSVAPFHISVPVHDLKEGKYGEE
jgi:hypothetical protein